MPVFLLPQFVASLLSHGGSGFVERVLKKTLMRNGNFKEHQADHLLQGSNGIRIRKVTDKQRVLYVQKGKNIYLLLAGEHSIENRVSDPDPSSFESALPVGGDGEEVRNAVAMLLKAYSPAQPSLPSNCFWRNGRESIGDKLLSRSFLPHRDIWLVAPCMEQNLFLSNAPFGEMLAKQAEDGARVKIITAVPNGKCIEWMKQLDWQGIEIFVYPRLHTKLYCFLLDENQFLNRSRYSEEHCSSLILLGSPNLTSASVGIPLDLSRSNNGIVPHNEELCYTVPGNEVAYVKDYVDELTQNGHDLPSLLKFRATGEW